jgi:sarcosine oxidase, subunit gamma
MSDALTRADPVPAARFAAKGVSISMAEPMMRLSLRARDPRWLDSLLRAKMPRKIGTCEGGIARLGPDEWLLRAPPGIKIPSPKTGDPLSITDIGERSICLIVEGPQAATLLMAGCPLDLDHFAPGRATRTIYETVEIILLRESEDIFHIEVWRSFAPWLWTVLTTTANHLE